MDPRSGIGDLAWYGYIFVVVERSAGFWMSWLKVASSRMLTVDPEYIMMVLLIFSSLVRFDPFW